MDSFVLVVLSVLTITCSSSQDIIETVEAVVGHSAELPCNVTAELNNDKLSILAWYKNGSANAFYSRDFRGGEDKDSASGANDRYRLVMGDDGLDRLQIITVKPSDAGLYQCVADFADSPTHKTFVQLNVIEPPRHLWVIHENGTQVAKASAGVNISQNVGPYYIGDTVHLFCVAFGGKPQASLSWRIEQYLLKDKSTPLSEYRVRSDVSYGPLRAVDHGRILSCLAQNNNRTSPLAIDIVIDMYLPPELVSLRAPSHVGGRVRAGEVLDLQCRVLGARPLPPIMWRIDDNQILNLEQNITMEPSQRLVMSDIQLTVTREYDEASLSCCAPSYTRDGEKFVCAEKLPLTVLYPPALEIVVEKELYNNSTLIVNKGSDVRMACTFQANPAIYQLIWFHEDDIMGERKDKTDTVQALLEIQSVSESDAGEYVCAATNEEGSSYSEPVRVNVTYPPYCEDESIAEYGIRENDSVNITCNVKANPQPTGYRWVLVNDAVNVSTMKNHAQDTIETEENVLQYQRPNDTTYSTVFCWGINEVESKYLPSTPCTFLVTDQTAPRPLTECTAVKNTAREIVVKCEEGHNGGLPQKFKFLVQSDDSDDNYLSLTTTEPEFHLSEPKQENYKFVISAFNNKGESKTVEIAKDEIVDESEVPEVQVSAVADITTLSLSLCGGVLLVALVACGLVLCAHDRSDRGGPRAPVDPPLCAYNTEESNCETYHGSEDDSECNVRRTESFRRAMARYPSRNFDVRRTSSFHSTRYIPDAEPEQRCTDTLRHNNCRVHSLQNINRKREMDALCDHLVLHLPPDTNYNAPRQMNTFYTMPRKIRQKMAKEISDEASEITQTSDGFSLPPPPDEFGTYRAGTRIKDIPAKTTPTYTTIKRNDSAGKEHTRQHYTNVMSPMNTIGLPTVSGAHNTLYTYPDDDHHRHHQVNTNPFDEDSS